MGAGEVRHCRIEFRNGRFDFWKDTQVFSGQFDRVVRLVTVCCGGWGTRGARREGTPAAKRAGLAGVLPWDFFSRGQLRWIVLTEALSAHGIIDSMSAATTTQAVRRWIMTGSVAAVTVAGTIYGAGLKEDHEVKKVRWAQVSSLKSSHVMILH